MVELVNSGTAEGMEGAEFTPAELAGQYAEAAARESGYEVDEGAIEVHLDFLSDAGGKFDYREAVAHGLAISAARNE